MKIETIDQAQQALHKYIDAVRKTGDNQSLARMWPLLEAVGKPHEKLRVIHVAGTSGKTSTCYYLSSMLHASGKNVGLTVSPHVDSITERVQINGSALSNDEFCKELEEFLSIVDGVGQPSYFELLIVFVLWVFARKNVEYVVLETGLGGLYDGTNVVSRADKVCVITHIGYDHMNILGNTIASIAAQKAGIIHKGNVVFSQQQIPEAHMVLAEHAAKNATTINFMFDTDHDEVGDIPLFQQANWKVAQAAAQYVAKRDGFEIVSVQPSQIIVPGRMEITRLSKGRVLIMDGAHNQQKMDAFVASFKQKFPNQKATILLALKEGKELSEVLHSIKPITRKLIATEFTAYQDLPFKALSAVNIASSALEIGIEATAEPDYKRAYQLLLKEDGLLIVTGSFYLLGQIRSL